MTRLAFVALLAFIALSPVAARQTPDPHAQMDMRGAQVMGFDQEKTTHHFYLYTDGGAIDVSVKDAADTTNRDAIRAHLPHVAMMFGMGNFDDPMMVHETKVPGTAEMATLKDRLSFKYTETPKGGRVDITTKGPEAVKAVHAFLTFQIAEHKTGESLAIKKR